MIREIYLRDPSDPKYVEGVFETQSEIELLLGQIRMLFFTRPREVMGDPNFGIDIESELYTLNLSQDTLKRKVQTAIYQYCPDAQKYDVQVSLSFFRGSVRDMCVIDILIDGRKFMGLLVK
jgi:hypothetical protein